MQMVNDVVSSIVDFVSNQNPIISFIMGFSLIILESIFPILPLAVFIAINTVAFGNVIGFILSWLATCMGCTLSFWIFRKGFSNYLYKKIDNYEKIKHFAQSITNISITKLILIIAIPFTPAFSVNIAAGLSKMSYKKFLIAILIGKLSIIYFWGFIGTTFIESVTDISVLIKLGIILFITFGLSKIAMKLFHIE